MTNITHDLLSMPYTRIFRAADQGGFTSEVMEFPGCFATGDTAAETMLNLEEAMVMWVEAEQESGHDIPEPLALDEYSGRMTLRIPSSLHQRAALQAQRENVSLNRFLSAAVASYVGSQPSLTTKTDPQSGRVEWSTDQVDMVTLSAMGYMRPADDEPRTGTPLGTFIQVSGADDAQSPASDGARDIFSAQIFPGYRDVIATDPAWGQQLWDRERLQSVSPSGKISSPLEIAAAHWHELARLLEEYVGAADSYASRFPEPLDASPRSDPRRPTP